MKKICPYCQYPNYETATFCISCQEEISHIEPNEYSSNQTPYYTGIKPIETSRYVACMPEEVSILKWLCILIGLAIPFLNIIMIISILIVSDNETVKNFAKANIIMVILGIIISFMIFLSKIA